MQTTRRAHPIVTRHTVSGAIAELMPYIIRGVQLEFFVKRGVTQTQFLLLVAIRAYPRCTMSVLAHNLHVSLPTASGIVERLVRAGYVRRVPRADDRRHVVVELTGKAQRFFRAFQRIIRRRWEEALRSLDVEELRAFHHVVTKLRQRLQQDTPHADGS